MIHISYSKQTQIIIAIAVVVVVIAASAGVILYEHSKSSKNYVLIGMPLPLNSPIATNMLDSAKLAVNQINANGGVTVNGTQYDLKIVSYDTQEADPSNPIDNGISAVTALITQDKVNFLIGGYRSDVVDAELPIATAYHTIYITFGADPEISTFVTQNYTDHKYIFNGFVNATNQGAQYGPLPVYMLLDYEQDLINQNITRIAVLGEQAAWTETDIVNGGTSSPLWGAFDAAGFNVTYINYFPLSPPGGSYNSLFSTLAGYNTQAIYVLAAGTETPLLISDWNSFSWGADTATGGQKPVLMGADVMAEMQGSTYDYYNATHGAATGEYTFGWGPMLPVNITDSSIPFYNDFYANYSFNPIFEDGFVYSSIYYLANAIVKAQSLSSDAVVPYLENTNYTGPAGQIQFSQSHGLIVNLLPVPSVPAVAMQWHSDGKLYYVWSSTDPLRMYNMQQPDGTVVKELNVTLA